MVDLFTNRIPTGRPFFLDKKRTTKDVVYILCFIAAVSILQKDNIDFGQSGRSLRTRKKKTYSSDDVFWTQANFTQKNYQLVFDGKDSFITYGEEEDPYKGRIYGANYRVVEALLNYFPDRFAPGQPPFQMLFSASDSPHTSCITHPTQCSVHHFAPVLQFGSVPMDPAILPTVVAMPLPTTCMKNKCSYELTDPNYEKLAWDELKPQIIWRGSDFCFERHFGLEWRNPADSHINLHNAKTTQDAIDALRISWDKLTPRWRGVLLSLMASKRADTDGNLPWIDAKFLNRNGKSKQFEQFEEIGATVSTTTFMGLSEQAAYKYHVDFGGGGGTTWRGTFDKLAMPGLLFHHQTSTKDFYYDELVPWNHYVPVALDLSDLRQKYEWAEANPDKAKEISKAATEFISKLKMDANEGKFYEKYMVKPLEKVVNAYQPGGGETLEKIEEQFKVGGPLPLKPLGRCSRKSCSWPGIGVSHPFNYQAITSDTRHQ